MHLESHLGKRSPCKHTDRFFNQLQGNAVRRLLELFDRYRGSLVTLDSQLKGMSLADRPAFRAALDGLPDHDREAILDRLVRFTRETLPELVDDTWSSYILDDPGNAERRFNDTVLDYFECCGELVDRQEVSGAGCYYGRLKAPWHITSPVVLVTRWEQRSAEVVRNVIEQIEPANSRVALVTGKELEEPFKHASIQAVVSYDAVCSQMATRIFDNVGISWIYC